MTNELFLAHLRRPVATRCAPPGLCVPSASRARHPGRFTVGEFAVCGAQRWLGSLGGHGTYERGNRALCEMGCNGVRVLAVVSIPKFFVK